MVETAESIQAKMREGVRPYPDIPVLGCGCIPGYFLCAEAEALWRQIGMAYQRYRLGEGSWMDCCEVRNWYNEHYLTVRRKQPL